MGLALSAPKIDLSRGAKASPNAHLCYICTRKITEKLISDIPVCPGCEESYIKVHKSHKNAPAKKKEETPESDFEDEDTPVMWGEPWGGIFGGPK